MAEDTTKKTVEFVVKGKDDGATGVFQKVRGALDELKNVFGRGSTLKETFEILEGGGKVAGFSLIGGKLKELSANLVEMREQLREGKTDMAGLAQAFLEGIPMISGYAAAGKNIREFITGEAATIKHITEETEATSRAIDAQKQSIKDQNEHHRTTLELIREIRKETTLAVVAALERGGIGGQLANEAQRQKLIEDAQRKKKEVPSDVAASMKELGHLANQNVPDASVFSGAGGAAGLYYATKERNRVLAEKENATAQLESLKRTEADRVRKIDEDTAAATRALDDKSAAEKADRQRELNDHLADLTRDGEDRLLKIKQDAEQEAMRARGETLQADLAQIRANYDQQIKQIRDNLEKFKRDNPGNVDEYRLRAGQAGQEINALSDKQFQEEHEAMRKSGEDARQHELDVGQKLATLKMQALQAEAQGMDKVKAAEVERLRVVEELRKKQDEVRAIINDPKASLKQKQDARGMFALLNAGAVAEIAKTIQDVTPSHLTATAQDALHPTLFLDRAKEDEKNQNKSTAENTKRAADYLQKIFEQIRAGKALIIPSPI